MGGGGREGDWVCSSCGNRNYAFRTFCNRCKQARILVDPKTPADSKWLPRIGDWICTGCTNNNYASREKCKKCGQPKDAAAMPAIAMSGASFPTYTNYFGRAQGVSEQNMNFGVLADRALQNSLPLSSKWSLGGADKYGSQLADKYGIQEASTWPSGGSNTLGFTHTDQANQLLKGWENVGWICSCGLHNYSSRTRCEKCNTSVQPALGTKRFPSGELVRDADNKRLNTGKPLGLQYAYPALNPKGVSDGNNTTGTHLPPHLPIGSSGTAPNLQVDGKFPHVEAMPTLLGKGAKYWRDGDWMCTNCNNHNYASRSCCNRCKTPKDAIAPPIGAA